MNAPEIRQLRLTAKTALVVLVALDWLSGGEEPGSWLSFRDWRRETEVEAGRRWSLWTFHQAVRVMETAGCIRRRPGLVQLVNTDV